MVHPRGLIARVYDKCIGGVNSKEEVEKMEEDNINDKRLFMDDILITFLETRKRKRLTTSLGKIWEFFLGYGEAIAILQSIYNKVSSARGLVKYTMNLPVDDDSHNRVLNQAIEQLETSAAEFKEVYTALDALALHIENLVRARFPEIDKIEEEYYKHKWEGMEMREEDDGIFLRTLPQSEIDNALTTTGEE